MTMVQTGSALSKQFFPIIGPAGTAWLRLTMAALLFVAVARPRVRGRSGADWRAAILLGIMTALMTVAFLMAIERIPLGPAVAIEFSGPLVVAVLRSGHWRGVIWPIIAAAGVVLMTEPWATGFDAIGFGLAAAAGFGWGGYIILTQKVGVAFSGIEGLAFTMPIAAIATATVGLPQAWPGLTPLVLLAGLGLAVIMPLIPFSLEMHALRRLPTATFGTLMALEPGVALLIGMVVLRQPAGPLQLAGLACVILAGIGAERHRRRTAL